MTAAPAAVPQAGGDLLVAKGCTKRFGGLVAVHDIDFTIPRGSIVSLIGPNGAGKTTFFNMITGLYVPTEGSIVFDGKDITGIKPHEVVRVGIARTFQNIRLFGNMSAEDNVLVGLHHRLKGRWFGAILRTPSIRREEVEAHEQAQGLLDLVGLKTRSGTLARNLPYGDQRRLEIARALATQPKLLLLDEPTAGMNPEETRRLTDFVRELRDRLGLTILLIEHDMKVVMGISDHVTVLDHGEKIAEGSPAEVRANVRVVEAYLGRGAAGAG
jgi:branched-chain amino acid transport system ATP-binding protein